MERGRRGREERLETEEAFDLPPGGIRGTFLAAAAPGEVNAIADQVLDLWSVRRRAYAPSSSLAHLPTYEAVARSLVLSATTLRLHAKQREKAEGVVVSMHPTRPQEVVLSCSSHYSHLEVMDSCKRLEPYN